MLTFQEIKELVQLVADRHLASVEVERAGFRLKIDGQAASPPATVVAVAPTAAAVPVAVAAPAAAAPPASAPAPNPAPAAEPVAADPAAGAHVMTSPIVGTFYRSPSPEAGPFVEVGSRVKKGQVLCIVEAMKLMNEIESDVDGVVTFIYPQNAQAVEFGQPLFAIKVS